MRKKLIIISAFAMLLLAVSSPAKANLSVDLVDSSDNASQGTYFLPSGTYERSDPYFRDGYEDWGWTHTFVSPPELMPESITSATLDVYAFDVDPSTEFLPPNNTKIYAGTGTGGVYIGQLNYADNAWDTTSFTLDLNNSTLLADLMDGTIDIWMDINAGSEKPDRWAVTLGWSELTVDYIPLQPTIPAPGAILLGSIGVCLVGWLTRKRII